MLSNSIASGFNKATATAAGDLSANLLQMIAASIGLVSILIQFQHAFIFIKWAGVAYLAYTGLRLIFTRASGLLHTGAKRSVRALYWQGFITSAANPKAIIFFAALFPQFIVANEPLVPQFLVLSVSYLLIDGLFLCFYGKLAAFFALKLSGSIGAYFNKISGSLFIGTAVVLGLKNFDLK
jgi:homoserine/homoserine lactone efflux protein